jgi:hypothetical protein
MKMVELQRHIPLVIQTRVEAQFVQPLALDMKTLCKLMIALM